MINIIIADDHQIVCKGISYTLSYRKDMKVETEVNSFAELSSALNNSTYEFLIMDLQLGDKNGVHAVREISDLYPDLKILVLSMLPEDPYALQSIHAGAMGYLNKSTMLDDLISAIENIISGKIYLSRSYAASLPYGTILHKTSKHAIAALSKREFEVYTLLTMGITYKEIAERLNVHPKTISTYRMRILEKLELSNNTQLIQHALHAQSKSM